MWFLHIIYSNITGLVLYPLRSDADEQMQAFSEDFNNHISHDEHLLSSLGVKDVLIDETAGRLNDNWLSKL